MIDIHKKYPIKVEHLPKQEHWVMYTESSYLSPDYDRPNETSSTPYLDMQIFLTEKELIDEVEKIIKRNQDYPYSSKKFSCHHVSAPYQIITKVEVSVAVKK